uniref:Uncharacterized protein n=1 Tax=viral metagenome TaxID=1070528 RepID=A0A6C0KYE8_9ZZZZ
MRLKLFNLSFLFHSIKNPKPSLTMKCNLHRDSFVGAWVLYEMGKKDVIHLQPHGSVYKTIDVNPTSYSEYVGVWEPTEEENEFYFYINDKNYYGKIINNTLEVRGTVCEGKKSPCYITNFTMTPLFEQFHNITFTNITDNFVYLNQDNVTGTWLMENTYTSQIYIIELFDNNTWSSLYSNKDILRGKWNLYNETINTNIVSKMKGKNIWISIVPQRFYCYSTHDIMFLGKITQLGTKDDSCRVPISSKINGSVAYCFGMDPEMSENFYMKRWFLKN